MCRRYISIQAEKMVVNSTGSSVTPTSSTPRSEPRLSVRSSVPLVNLRCFGADSLVALCHKMPSQPFNPIRASYTNNVHDRHSRPKEDDSKVAARWSVGGMSAGESSHSQSYFMGGMCSVSETMENVRTTVSNPVAPPSVQIKHYTRQPDGRSRFPKLDECAHFHYDNVELGPIMMCLCDELPDSLKASQLPVIGIDKENEGRLWWFCVEIASNGRSWVVRRNYENFRMLDKQLHRCVYDRKFSLLTELPAVEELPSDEEKRKELLRTILRDYISRFSDLAGSLISCGPVLNWLELDNRGNRLIVTDEASINTPAVAAAYVIKRYTALAGDEITFEVGDMVSVIDMPPPEESTWWRGKRGYEVGFFPSECVEVIGEKVPQTLKIPETSTKPVLRKHGKLIAFFRSFLLSRPSRGKLKQSGILKERVFGCDLGEHLLNTSREIPLVLKCCTEFIESHGIVDGIYRLSGVTSNIQKLRLGFDEDRAPDLSDEAILQDVHCVASLLKMYFRELPNPLLTYQLYDKFVSAVQSQEDFRLLKLRDVVQQLPPPHYRTLEFLMQHLAKVASYGSHTSMTPKNLAIVWAPNLLRSKDVESGGGVGALHIVGVQAVLTEYLIRYVDLIFNDKLPILQSPSSEQDASKKLRPKSVAISTPTKLLSLEEARSRVLTSNLPVSQQKYIDVGSGPEGLPDKYHTVIELSSSSKRSSGKLKKSPSGWKSFFSRGWNSGSAREKDRGYHDLNSSHQKTSTCSVQYASTNIPLKERAVTEMEMPHVHSKSLPEKRAESIISSLDKNDTHYCTSEILQSLSPSEGLKIVWSNEGFTKEENSPYKSSNAHKHIRSVSHDSYFENTVDIPAEDTVEENDGSVFLQMESSMLKESRSEEQSFSIKSAVDYARDNGNASLQKEFGNSKCEEEVKNLTKESYSESSKSSRKQRLRSSDSDVSSPKMQKLNFKHFRQAFSSPSFGKKLDFSFIFSEEDSSSNISQEKEKDFLRGSIRKTKEWFVQTLSPDTGNKKILPFPIEQEFKNSVNIPQANKSIEVISKTFNKDLVNNSLSICTAAENTFIKQSSNLTTYDGRAQRSFISDLGDKEITGKTVIERYGNEETVIVEVHATQESSSEEDEKLEESYRVVDEMLQAASKKIEQEQQQDDRAENTERILITFHLSYKVQLRSLLDPVCMPKVEPSEKADENQVSKKFHHDTIEHVKIHRSVFLHPFLSSKKGNLGDDVTINLAAAPVKHSELTPVDDTEKYLSDMTKTNCTIPDSSSSGISVAVNEQNSYLLPLDYSKDMSEKSKINIEELWFSSSSVTPENEDQHVSDLEELFSYKLLDEYDTAMTPGQSITKTLPKSSPNLEQDRDDLCELKEKEKTENICVPLRFLPISNLTKQEDLKTKNVEEMRNLEKYYRNTYTASRTCKAMDENASLNILSETIESFNLQKTSVKSRLSCEGICSRNTETIQNKLEEEEELKANKQKDSMMMEQELGNNKDVQSSSIVSSQKLEISSLQDRGSSDLTFRKRMNYEKPSPVEECKRKFESEIGRTIVRDRKMKLEMEQIKAEMQEKFQNKQEKSLSNFNKDSQLLTQTQKLDSSWEITKEYAKKTSDVVELRRSPGRQFVKPFEEKENERKRMSEPIGTSLRLIPTSLVEETKRVSEPSMTQVYLRLPPENKASLKQLVSKFESSLQKEEYFSSEKKPYETDLLDDSTFIKYSSPVSNIFTQIKNLTLQSEQPTQTVSAKHDQWSDSIQKDLDPHDFTQYQNFSSKLGKTEAQKADSWGPQTTLSKKIKEATLLNSIKPQTLDLKKTSTYNSKKEDILTNFNIVRTQNRNKKHRVQIQEISLSENKDMLENPVGLSSTNKGVFGPIRWHSLSPLNSPTRDLESHGRFRSESSPVDSKIINQRERINRLKEERRNQLREKWRSDSLSKDSNGKEWWRRNTFSSRNEPEMHSRIFSYLSSPVKEWECHTVATCPAVYLKDTGPKPLIENKVGEEEGKIWVRERAQKWQKQFLEKVTNPSLSCDISHYSSKHFTEDVPSACKGKVYKPVFSHGTRSIPEKKAAGSTVNKAHIESLTLNTKSIPATHTNQIVCNEESKIVPKIFLSEETASVKTSSDNSREGDSLQHVPSPQKHIRDRVAVFEATS
ncbi:LOW QUALITY PROTEIN: uncharacterized protein LOC143255339 [Tachypleus tridentatus]|uniref:LOW QUALITY PROTEIN: uncharacterized protein LOC143255339 n=1 Tax=Tachypleus tridentatus TaxID=6853 RepID=UPI003FD1BD44